MSPKSSWLVTAGIDLPFTLIQYKRRAPTPFTNFNSLPDFRETFIQRFLKQIRQEENYYNKFKR